MMPGRVERIEFEYKRHGTCTVIANFDVATGRVLSPTVGDTRTEKDFVKHIEKTIHDNPSVKKWHFVLDGLNTHKSESLVRFVARYEGIKTSLGKKGVCGVLKNMSSRAAFLSSARHKIVFHYTPKHCSWMNQVEIWFGILSRKLIKRGSFKSKHDLKCKILSFIKYFNDSMSKPFKWSYNGKVLCV